MKMIQCIIRPEKLNDIVTKLVPMIPGMTVSEVRGHGRQGGHPAVYRGVEYHLSLLPKVMIEIAIDDSQADDIVKLLTETARTGEIGDGRIFVLDIEATYHVRTGFMDL